MPPITISLNPSYLCNFRCDFCYLSESQLADKRLLPIEKLQSLLEEVSKYRQITTIDLYGGEPTLLPKAYFFDLLSSVLQYVERINIITNLSVLREVLEHPMLNLYVSYDFTARESSETVFKNMQSLSEKGIPFDVLTLVSPKVLSLDTDEMVRQFKTLKTLNSVELKPYSNNQNNAFNVKDSDFEDFVIRFIKSSEKQDLYCANSGLIQDALSGYRNSFSDDHIYITPDGFAVLEFDLNNNEFFQHLDSFEDYILWTEKEKARVSKNAFCSQCEYFGRCLSEHLREVKSLENSCNGYYRLLKQFEGKVKCY